MRKLSLRISFSIVVGILFVACSGDFKPKPKGLNFIDLPEKKYRQFEDNSKPYTFEQSVHTLAYDDTSSIFKERKRLYKILKYPELNSSVYLTYKNVDGNIDSLDSYINEAFRLTYGHDVKAYGITPETGVLSNGNYLTTVTLEGEVPSPFQFFVHDSTNNFMRGVVYFPVADKNDSLAPVIDYVKEDVLHLIKTLKWKN